jgi:hypothetical protein
VNFTDLRCRFPKVDADTARAPGYVIKSLKKMGPSSSYVIFGGQPSLQINNLHNKPEELGIDYWWLS